MSLLLRVVENRELEEIMEFERKKLHDQIPSPSPTYHASTESDHSESERMFAEWSARWRKEALEHYLPMGWCFLARDEENKVHSEEGELVGYFLAQPLLFFDGQTQSLWVDHLQFSTLQARDELCELATKLSREKHFQRVYFPQSTNLAPTLKSLKAVDWNAQTCFIKTTKG